ncbi:hypothetical protein AAFF_G00342300 [Aldrovandia affinis]|uniref:Uncharacterized protein n=1 Tax=Aldrovandia affinis TaxID=143900 RepID=A0AAD7R679_9TELE|nr:hypothetical protein AAFF_G00342300 [Aldrovandia affinis]
MMTRNLDTEDGIVNGTFGTIANIVPIAGCGLTTVKLIGLELDNPTAGQKFRRKIPGATDDLVYIESRTTSLEGLRIIDFEQKKIYADPNVTTAMENMSHASFQSTRPLLHFVKSAEHAGPTLTVVHHNAEGLPPHIEDLKSHHKL